MLNSKYKAVIFDFDDTLVESYVQKWAQYKHVAKKFYNVDLRDEAISKHWGKPFDLMITEIFRGIDTPENIKKLLRVVREDFLKKEQLGSMDVLKTLAGSGIKIAILSATNHDNVVEDLERFNFPINLLTSIQGANETIVHKPNPDVFLPLFDKLKEEGIRKEDIVCVGDSLDDLKAAEKAGIDFIAITTGLYSKEDFKNNGAENIINNIQEIIS